MTASLENMVSAEHYEQLKNTLDRLIETNSQMEQRINNLEAIANNKTQIIAGLRTQIMALQGTAAGLETAAREYIDNHWHMSAEHFESLFKEALGDVE